MSSGPPFDKDRAPTPPDSMASRMTRLDYPGRDIRVLPTGEGMFRDPDPQVKQFGDFDPNEDDPDPDVWPLEGYDPGYPAPTRKLIRISNSYPEPHVAWVTEEYLEALYGYNPVRQSLHVDELPPWKQPDTLTHHDTVDVVATNESTLPMELTSDRHEALRRIARLWNGDVVRGQHLLRDKLPNWSAILGDLDQDELKRLVVDPEYDYDLHDAFGHHPWFTKNASVYAAPKRILRKKVWYSPTLKGRTLINRRDDIPSLHGDPNEGLPHRVAVGLARLREHTRGRTVRTYYDLGEYTVDIASKDDTGHIWVGEVLTGHHNRGLNRHTYRKLTDLEARGATTCLIFDRRDTAYEVINHLHNHDTIEARLPSGTFDSEMKISRGQERIKKAYEESNWSIPNWTTTDVLWRETLGDTNTTINPDILLSTDW